MEKKDMIPLIDIDLYTDKEHIYFYRKNELLNKDNKVKQNKLYELILSPTRKVDSFHELDAYQIYISNNLYRVVTNGGKEFCKKQKEFLSLLSDKIKEQQHDCKTIIDEERIALSVNDLVKMENILNDLGRESNWHYSNYYKYETDNFNFTRLS